MNHVAFHDEKTMLPNLTLEIILTRGMIWRVTFHVKV